MDMHSSQIHVFVHPTTTPLLAACDVLDRRHACDGDMSSHVVYPAPMFFICPIDQQDLGHNSGHFS